MQGRIGLPPNGTFIRTRRRELGRSPGEFAKACGISYSSLANTENGHRKRVSVVVLARIARELNTAEKPVQIEDLIATGDTESSDAA